jgi:[acyl-carrier-protein] S-malonyltransferase
MSAVLAPGIAERPGLAEMSGPEVDIANKNSMDQVVLSGATPAVEAAEQRARAAEAQVIRLNVSAPFHSRLMRTIEPEFRSELEAASARISADKAAVVTSNLRGGFHDPRLEALIDALTGQISRTVDWIGNMRALGAAAEHIVEVGPGRPLGRFFASLGITTASITSVKTAERALRR